MSEENPVPASSQEESSLYLSEEVTPTDQDATDEDAQESVVPAPTLPPEAQGEANGGPLGCCLGITVGLMFGLLIGLIGFANFGSAILTNAFHGDPLTYVRIATAIFGGIGVILGGPIGWRIGKRVYREYDRPVVKDRRSKSKPIPKSAR
ncbi:MAG: hypothetical protein WCD86_17340 [Ktedonobacteraceae bacterium]